MYNLSATPAPRTCRLCPAEISQYAKYCEGCMRTLTQTRRRVVYTVLQRLEAELPTILRQMQEAS